MQRSILWAIFKSHIILATDVYLVYMETGLSAHFLDFPDRDFFQQHSLCTANSSVWLAREVPDVHSSHETKLGLMADWICYQIEAVDVVAFNTWEEIFPLKKKKNHGSINSLSRLVAQRKTAAQVWITKGRKRQLLNISLLHRALTLPVQQTAHHKRTLVAKRLSFHPAMLVACLFSVVPLLR